MFNFIHLLAKKLRCKINYIPNDLTHQIPDEKHRIHRNTFLNQF